MKRNDDKKKDGKRPAFQFYPGDWLRDPNLRSCSLAARGLWIDMMCFMHESSRRGFLVTGTAPLTAEKLARMVGATAEEATALLAELREANVFSEMENGTIYSRRIVRDEMKSETNTKNGVLGGNPLLLNLVTGAQASLLEPGAVVNPTPDSGRKEDSVNRVSQGSVKGGDNRDPEEEDEEEAEEVLGRGVRGGGMDEFGEPTWRTGRRVRIPEDFFATKSMRLKARAKGIEHDAFLDWETEKLINWAVNVKGEKGSKTDWARAWQNWIMRAIEDGEYERWKRRTAGPGSGGLQQGGPAATGSRPADRYSPEAIAARRDKRGGGDGGSGGEGSDS